MTKNTKISIFLNYLIAFLSILGVVLACLRAEKDGYSHWYKRLLYFTQQSNLWIGASCILTALILQNEKRFTEYYQKTAYLLKYIFTVSITVTGIVFCVLLAPFADYDVWSFSSVLTHVVVPLLSILDFLTYRGKVALKKKQLPLTLIPPLYYVFFSIVLSALEVDFGRGTTYPYVFLDFQAEVGLFGFQNGDPPSIGTAYWLIVILLFILAISYLYYRLHLARNQK